MTQTMADELTKIPMSAPLQAALGRAVDYASGQSHAQVTLEHLLLALTEDEDAATVMQSSRIDLGRLRNDVAGYLGGLSASAPEMGPTRPAIATSLTQVLSYAALAARQGRRSRIDGAIVLAALVGEGRSMAASFLKAQGLSFEEAIRVLQRAAAPGGAPQQAPPARAQSALVQPALSGAAAGASPSSPAESLLAAARERVEMRAAQRQRPDGPVTTLHRAPAQRGLDPPAEPPAMTAPAAEPEAVAPELPLGLPEAPPEQIQEALERRATELAAVQAAEPDQGTETWPQERVAPAPAAQADSPAEPVAAADAHQLAPATGAAAPQPQPATWVPPPLPIPQSGPRTGVRTQPPPAGFRSHRPPMPIPPSPDRPMRPEPPAPWTATRERSGADHFTTPPTRPVPVAGGPAGAPQGGMAARATAGSPMRGPATAATTELARAPAIDGGKVSHTIPARMRSGHPVTVEVRVGRAPIPSAGQGPVPSRKEHVLARAISVRMRGARPLFAIESSSPETQWDQATGATGRLSGDTAIWRFTVTPQKPGTGELQVQVSARAIGADGLIVDTVLPESSVAVRVAWDLSKLLRRWALPAGLALLSVIAVELIEEGAGVNILPLVRRLIGL